MQKITEIVNIWHNLQQMKHVSKFAQETSSNIFVIDFLCGLAENMFYFCYYHYESNAIIAWSSASRSGQHVKLISQ